ncbi:MULTISPECIES: NRDE family protein [unclassified Luteimonas]
MAIAWRVHPRWQLALIANRDEAHARPSAQAGFDPDAPDVYGGRDLAQGGGWLQLSRGGRVAAVTNVRAGRGAETAPRSRGWLVRDFVRGHADAGDFTAALGAQAADYGRFNLLVHDGAQLVCASNHPAFSARTVAPGMHAMSNGGFDAPWPKGVFATRALQAWLESPLANTAVPRADTIEPLFTALRDTTRAPDQSLPDTGVGIELERMLSSPFVLDPTYGTRCSSVVLASAGELLFAERRYGADGAALGTSIERLPRA